MKYPCSPVGYCFPASIPLVTEDYNVHTIHFDIPQWLPPTAVPMIYRSVFEHTPRVDHSQ